MPRARKETPSANAIAAVASPRKSVEPAGAEVRKIALVTHDYNMPDSRRLYDYSEHFARINRICDAQVCDTILYALYTWDSTSSIARTQRAFFDGLKNVKWIILEVYEPSGSTEGVEVWMRGQTEPVFVQQRFATSSSSTASKQQFFDELPSRQFGNALLMICGETNIASLVRGSEAFYDPFGFADRLRT